MWHEVNRYDPASARFAFNWLVVEASKLAEEKGASIAGSGISASSLCEVARLVREGELSSTNAKALLSYLWDEGIGPGRDIRRVAEERGLIQKSDAGELGRVVDEVLASQAKAVEDYKSGNQRAFGALVGAAMKATKGQGNPQLITKMLRERLGG